MHSEFCSVVSLRTVLPEGQDPIHNQKITQQPMKLPLNPGDGRTFPWLSGIATRFEKYKFKKIVVRYLPTVSTIVNGGVALCPIYDPADPIPSNRITLLNSEGMVRGAVHNEITLTIPANRMRHNDTLFVRETHEELMDPNELRLSDLGYVVVSLTDVTSLDNLGDIFIEYHVELTSPRVGPRIGKCAHFRRQNVTLNPSSPTGHAALLGDGFDATDRSFHSPANTLMIDVDHRIAPYSHSVTAANMDTTRFTFKEPFSGMMSINHSSGTSLGASDGNHVVNGVRTKTEKGAMEAIGGPDNHDQPWGLVDLVHSLATGAGYAVSLYKVAAQAGDVIEAAFDATGGDVMDDISVIFSDMAPALLELLP